MKLVLVFLAVMALASASYIKPTKEVKYFDKDMVYKQKFFLDILFKVWKPLYFQEYVKMGEHFVYEKSYFSEYDKDMEYFYEVYKTHTFTPKGVTFTLFNKRFLKEVAGLFKFFYYAKDFETFQKNVCWARQYVNEGVFVYALQMFVMHSEHYKYIVLPPLYEIFPFYFFNGKFINTVKEFDYDFYKYEDVYEKEFFKYYETLEPYYKAYVKKFDWFNKKWHFFEEPKLYRDEYQMTEDFKFKDIFEGTKKFWVKADYAGKYDFMNEEYKLSYFTEDFDFNLFWYYFNLQYPCFLEGEKFHTLDSRRGEYLLFVIQQILARYQLERYSHGFGEIEEFSWYSPVEYGYNPQLVAYNGLSYSYRPNNYYYIPSNKFYHVAEYTKYIEEKFAKVIELGYYETADGTKFYFNKPESINYIGLMLQGSVDSIDRKFFSSWFFIYHTMLAYGEEYNLEGEYKYFDYMPNVMWNFATMMRDPLFYQVYTKVYKIYSLFKYQLPHYSETELFFPGVKITDVHVDKLYTYFDIYDADVSTLVNKDYFFKDGKFHYDYAFFGRRVRLNNKPFTIKYDFESDKPQKVVFRTFIGPKYDEFGKEMVFDYSRKYFVEIDQFYYEAVAGKNSYVRDSQHFFWTHKDFTTYFELYKYAFYASEGKYQFPVDYDMNKFCGFPERLVLPKGWTDGMPMKVYVIVTPFDSSVKEYSYEHHDFVCGEDFDKLPYGFPLDRTIDMYNFWYPNMYYSDFYIYHLKDLHIPEEYKTYFYDYHYYY